MNPSFGDIISQLNLNKVVGKYTWHMVTIEHNLRVKVFQLHSSVVKGKQEIQTKGNTKQYKL